MTRAASRGRPMTASAATSSMLPQSNACAQAPGSPCSAWRMNAMALPPQGRALCDIHRAHVPVQVDQDRETDRRFRRGERDGEQREGEAVGVAPVVGEGHEVDVGGVEDELRGDEDAQRAAVHEQAEDADREEGGREHRGPGDGDHWPSSLRGEDWGACVFIACMAGSAWFWLASSWASVGSL